MATSDSTYLEVRHKDVAYERRDLSWRAVFGFLAVLACSALIIHLVIWSAFQELGKAEFVPHQTTNPIETSNEELQEIGGDPALSFPMPRLQPNPVADLNKFRAREEQELNSYGWVDPQAGKVHIPIERAIDITASTWPKQQESTTDGGQTTPDTQQNAPAANSSASGGGR